MIFIVYGGTARLMKDCPSFFGSSRYARKKLGQPPARFGITYNAPSLCARRRQSHFLLRSCGERGSPQRKGDDRPGSNRVKRGGNWNNNAQNCRSANRNNNWPDNRNNNIGFRLVSSSRCQIAGVYGGPRRAPVMTRSLSCSGIPDKHEGGRAAW